MAYPEAERQINPNRTDSKGRQLLDTAMQPSYQLGVFDDHGVQQAPYETARELERKDSEDPIQENKSDKNNTGSQASIAPD